MISCGPYRIIYIFMKFYITIFLLLIFTTAFAASHPNVSENALKRRTILIYMAANNDLDPFAELNLKQMVKEKIPDDVNIVVQISRSSASWNLPEGLKLKRTSTIIKSLFQTLAKLIPPTR